MTQPPDDQVSPEEPPEESPRELQSRRSPLVAPLVVLAVVSLMTALVFGLLLLARGGPVSTAASSTPADTSAEAGFARDMQAHHRQAVTMSLLVLERTDDAQVRTLASDILLTQQQQAGQMHGWLDLWGLPQTGSRPVMAWMGHDADGGHDAHGAGGAGGAAGPADMPGMASAADLQRLEAADSSDADRLYLQLMIPHHEGGVEMAAAALGVTDDPTVTRLAEAVVTSQRSELTVLRALLDERGGPLTS